MLTIRDKIRAACHYLRMHPLGTANPSKINDLRTRISKLPTAEAISSMPRTELGNLKGRVDRIMYDLDLSNDSRTNEYALRNMVDKGLPPHRSPVLARSWYARSMRTADKRHLVNSPETEDDRAFRHERVRSPSGQAVRENLRMEDDMDFRHERLRYGWWCPRCRTEVPPSEVTFEETHDKKRGGCGGHVIKDQLMT